MNRVYEFLKAAETYYLATVEGDQPRVRPFGTVHMFEGKLYIQTGKGKTDRRQPQGGTLRHERRRMDPRCRNARPRRPHRSAGEHAQRLPVSSRHVYDGAERQYRRLLFQRRHGNHFFLLARTYCYQILIAC